MTVIGEECRVGNLAGAAEQDITSNGDANPQANRKPIQPAKDAPQPLSPAASAARIRLPEGFRIELVASEPVVKEPSCIAFDEHGRLFVCELHGYNIEGHLDVTQLNKTGQLDMKVRRIRWELQGGAIADAAAKLQFGVVKLLSDSDGDGVMDRAEVWADDLPPCYGVVPARGGIIVVCAPDIVYLADRDEDGKPEVRETLFTGFRTTVLERGINNPRWGLDNWIYVGAGGNGGTITGPRLAGAVELRHSDFRIRSDGSAIEPVSGRVGTFGLTMNDIGDRFPSTGGRPAMYALPLPDHYLARNPYVATPDTNHSAATYNRGYRISQPHPWRVRRQQDPAWVKFYGAQETNSNYFSGGCSNEFYGDTLFPQQYWGNIFYCEPSLNIVHRCVVNRDGAGYRGRRADSEQESEFLASMDQWFRPMNLRVGPEGALYIVDMYREIIEDYSAIPRFLQQQYGLDKGGDRGRIWRLVPAASEKRFVADLASLSEADLAEELASAHRWRRATAQRLLIERGATSVSRLISTNLRKASSPHARLHMLYTLAGMDVLTADDVAHALGDNHYGVRVHALRLSERWLGDSAIMSQVLAKIGDEDPSVRLQLAMTLGESTDGRVNGALLTLANRHGGEQWMAAAILSSSQHRAADLLADLLQQTQLGRHPQALLRPLAATVAGQRDISGMSRILASLGDLPAEIQTASLSGLLAGISQGSEPIPDSADGWAPLAKLLRTESPAVREVATKLSAKLPLADEDQLRKIFDDAAESALDEQRRVDERAQSMRVLASAPHTKLAPVAEGLLHAGQPPSLQLAAVTALGSSTAEGVASTLLSNWSTHTPAVRKAVMRAIFARVRRWPSLLDAIEAKTVETTEITAIQREQLLTSNDQRIAERARQLLVNPAADAELQQRIDTYQQALSGRRDIEQGKEVFAKNCLTCHKLGSEGHEVGPPLGTIVNKPDETVLVDLLDPSGRIEPEYRSYIVATTDGRSLTGLITSESPTSITLVAEKGVSASILRRDIEQIKASSVSLMPSNLHEQIGPQQAADVIGFMRAAFRDATVAE